MADEIFAGTALGLQGIMADSTIFDPASPMTGHAKYFNSDYEATMEAGAADAPDCEKSSVPRASSSSSLDDSR